MERLLSDPISPLEVRANTNYQRPAATAREKRLGNAASQGGSGQWAEDRGQSSVVSNQCVGGSVRRCDRDPWAVGRPQKPEDRGPQGKSRKRKTGMTSNAEVRSPKSRTGAARTKGTAAAEPASFWLRSSSVGFAVLCPRMAPLEPDSVAGRSTAQTRRTPGKRGRRSSLRRSRLCGFLGCGVGVRLGRAVPLAFFAAMPLNSQPLPLHS